MKHSSETISRVAHILPLLFCLLMASASCRTGSGERAETPRLTVSIEPIRYFTEAIAGPRFRVNCMVPDGNSPESYDPTPRQFAALAESKAYLRIGHIGFEQTWMDRMTANNPEMLPFDLSEGIDLIHEGEEEENPLAGKDSDGRQMHEGHRHGGVEPHIWNSPANARVIAGNILRALCTLDAVHSDEYRQRHDSLCQRIARTDSIVRSYLSLPDSERTFLIYHPALSYFAREYGLRQVPIEAGGKEPTTIQLKKLIDFCRENEVHTIFVQPEFDQRNASLIRAETRAAIVQINPLAYDWEKEIIATARSLSKEERLRMKEERATVEEDDTRP